MKRFTIKLQKGNTRGFTLVESLVAISILMIAVASPLTLAQKGISTAILSRDQMTASFLVQDGIEAVKNIRDHTAVSSVPNSGTSWLAGLDANNVCICDNSASGMMCDLNNLNTANYCNIDTTTDTNLVYAKGVGD